MSKIYYPKNSDSNTSLTKDLPILRGNKEEDGTKYKKNIPSKNNYQKKLIEFSQRRAPLPATIMEIKESRTKQHELDFMKLFFEKDMEEHLSHERYKIEREIFALESKFGKSAARNFVEKALSDCDEIFKCQRNRAFSVATDARFLAGEQSISQLFDYETNGIKKIVGDGKCDFQEILSKLNHIEVKPYT